MNVEIENPYRLHMELRRTPDLSGVPLWSEDVTDHLADLVDETFTRGVLANVLPERPDDVVARITPVWSETPLVERVVVHIRARMDGVSEEFQQEFRSGRWSRESVLRIHQLRHENTLDDNESAYRLLMALPADDGPGFELPPLQAPPILDGTLEQFGIRTPGSGQLVPDRPILVNEHVVADSVSGCVAAGAAETGYTGLGAIVRLASPLPGTSTPIVTLLTSCVEDRRHVGQINEWSISPEALADADRVARIRGLGESVLTVIHTHGFNTECGNCNTNAACPLAECTHVSLKDYQVLESLFPGKATLMPIVGRRIGAEGNRPVLAMHAWRGGEVRPVRWTTCAD